MWRAGVEARPARRTRRRSAPSLPSGAPAEPSPTPRASKGLTTGSQESVTSLEQVMGVPSPSGRFGEFGGRFVPEILVPACQELEAAFDEAWNDPAFRGRLDQLLGELCGSADSDGALWRRLSEQLGIDLLLKREDLTHTGSHKINNVLGQALLAQQMGKPRLIAETGAGQHGVADGDLAAALAWPRVRRLHGLGRRAPPGAERVSHAVARRRGALGVVGLAHAQGCDQRGAARLGRAPSSRRTTASDRSSVRIPTPTWCGSSSASSATKPRQTATSCSGADPDYVVACVGGGSNAAGTFAGFADRDESADGRRGRRWRGDRARRAGHRARHALAVPPRRGRPDPRSALDLGRPRLPRRRARSTRTFARSSAEATLSLGRTTKRCSTRSRCSRAPKGSSRRSNRHMRSRGCCARRRAVRCRYPASSGCSSPSRAVATRTSPRCARSSAKPVNRPPLEATACARAASKGEKLLVPVPDRCGFGGQWTEALVQAEAEAGANAIEVGLPFSDPVMDGPTIQEASEIALREGATAQSIIQALHHVWRWRPSRFRR